MCVSLGKTWYLPHHNVVNVNKPAKTRTVFDCIWNDVKYISNNFFFHSSLSSRTAVQKKKKKKNYFIYTSHHFNPHGRYELNKLTSLLMCGFIAQLVEQHTGNAEVTGSNPVGSPIFFRLLLSNCLITAMIILHFQFLFCHQQAEKLFFI